MERLNERDVTSDDVADFFVRAGLIGPAERDRLEQTCRKLLDGATWRHERTLGRRRMWSGAYIFEQGSFADAFYLLEEGRLEMVSRESRSKVIDHLGYIRQGEVFGEGVLLDEMRRSYSVQALQDGSIISIHKDAAGELLGGFPSIMGKVALLIKQRQGAVDDLAASRSSVAPAPAPPRSALWRAIQTPPPEQASPPPPQKPRRPPRLGRDHLPPFAL